MAKKNEKTPQNAKAKGESDLYLWMAAIAAHEVSQKLEGKGKQPDSWEAPAAADARLLYYRAELPLDLDACLKRNAKAHEDSPFMRTFESETLPKPAGFKTWATTAAAFWQRLGVSLDFDALAEGARVHVSPYHVRAASDPKHPLFNAEKARRREKDMRELMDGIRAVGFVVHTVFVSVWPDEDGEHLYVVDGGRRHEAVLRLNHEELGEYCDNLRDADSIHDKGIGPLPLLVRSLKAEISKDQKTSQVVRSVANHHRLNDTVVAEAREASRLVNQLGYSRVDAAAMLGKSEATIDNLLRLAKLTPKLRDLLEDGTLQPSLAYLLAQHPAKKQAECWKAIEAIPKAADKLRAAEHWLRTGELPAAEAAARKPLPRVRVLGAAARLKARAGDPALQPYIALLAAISGDEAAFGELPEDVQAALSKPKPPVPWEGVPEAERAAWQGGVGVFAWPPVLAMRKAGLTAEECGHVAADPDEPAVKRPLGQLYAYGVLTLDELVAEVTKRRAPNGCEGDVEVAATKKGLKATPGARVRRAWDGALEEWEAGGVFDERLAGRLAAAGLTPQDMARPNTLGGPWETLGQLVSHDSQALGKVIAHVRQLPLPDGGVAA